MFVYLTLHDIFTYFQTDIKTMHAKAFYDFITKSGSCCESEVNDSLQDTWSSVDSFMLGNYCQWLRSITHVGKTIRVYIKILFFISYFSSSFRRSFDPKRKRENMWHRFWVQRFSHRVALRKRLVNHVTMLMRCGPRCCNTCLFFCFSFFELFHNSRYPK
jgi:hypothetical protein